MLRHVVYETIHSSLSPPPHQLSRRFCSEWKTFRNWTLFRFLHFTVKRQQHEGGVHKMFNSNWLTFILDCNVIIEHIIVAPFALCSKLKLNWIMCLNFQLSPRKWRKISLGKFIIKHSFSTMFTPAAHFYEKLFKSDGWRECSLLFARSRNELIEGIFMESNISAFHGKFLVGKMRKQCQRNSTRRLFDNDDDDAIQRQWSRTNSGLFGTQIANS